MTGSTYSLMLVWAVFAQALNAVPVTPMVAGSDLWPPKNSAWVGDQPHYFLGGQVVLFCGTHGVFSTQAKAPSRQGQVSTIQYGAVFKGELTLNPPLVARSSTYAINDPIRISERVTAVAVTPSGTEYATELNGLTFKGPDFPDGIVIRESPRRRSAGHTSIYREGAGHFRIHSQYEVWLEVSQDNGRTWHLADNAVRMQLHPQVQAATIGVRKPAH